ncbi:MAG: glycosyltransferase family 39 protein [Gemmatimonadales bacterium]
MKKPGSSRPSLLEDHRVLLGLVLFAGLAVRLWFADGRWLNPDEGAHLMDALLVLKGHVPIADYEARQPFYVYFLAAFLRLFGTSITAARIYPIVTSVAVGGLTYLIGARLLDRRIGLLAAALYMFMPFTVAYGTHAKSEPLTLLLSCAAVYLVLVALDRRRVWLLAVSGMALALAYYSRQSSLGVVLAVGIVLLFRVRRPAPLLRAGGVLAGGYLVVCGVMIAAFATVLPMKEILNSALNPVGFVTTELVKAEESASRDVVTESGTIEASQDAEAAQAGEAEPVPEDQPRSVTVHNIVDTLRLNSLLIVGLALSPWLLLLGADPEARTRRRLATATLYAWAGGVGLAYAYWALRRGFFPAYFGELIPPLALLTAAVGVYAVSRLSGTRSAGWRDVGWFAAIGIATLAVHAWLGPETIYRPLYFVLAAPLLGLLYLSRGVGRREIASLVGIAVLAAAVIAMAGDLGTVVRLLLYGLLFAVAVGLPLWGARVHPGRQPGLVGAFVGLTLLTGTAMLWLGTSQARIDRRFDGIWPPESVEAVAASVDEMTGPDDRVMSGAVVWEFVANREPFMRISHPLLLRKGISRQLHDTILARFEDAPPGVVILDGYTEQTYLRMVPELRPLIDRDYELVREFSGARYPVRVYERASRASTPGDAGS